MKKILLLSDTHGHLDDFILRHAGQADEIWHAGDLGTLAVADRLQTLAPLRCVYGNIDDHLIRSTWPLHASFEVEGLRVLMLHIGGYPGRYNTIAAKLIQSCRPDLFICGHSHVLKIMRDPRLHHLHMNPGAAGIHGFHTYRTMIRFQITDGSIHETEVIELGRSGKSTKAIG